MQYRAALYKFTIDTDIDISDNCIPPRPVYIYPISHFGSI